jgi:alpha-glucosidase
LFIVNSIDRLAMVNNLHWTAGLHHDGSALYVSNPLPAIGETVTIKLRTPNRAPIQSIFIRSAPDGENHYDSMILKSDDGVSAWWEGELKAVNPRNQYRFRILTEEGAYYLNAAGCSRAEAPDYFDFKLLADYQAPTWVRSAVFYQIFPDRFHNGDPSNDVPDGAWSSEGKTTKRRPWGALPSSWSESGSLDFFGGDLAGVQQKLDYLRDLGVNAIYLNPIFDSETNHGYDIKDFHHVAPHMGGDEALAELRRALDDAGMRLMLDITPNHASHHHPWFLDAQQNADAPTAEFFTFYKRPDDYEAWFGVKTLPKLNYKSEALRDAMYRAPDSALRHWLREPYRIDAWRLDVMNMTARQGAIQLGNKVGRQIRRAVKGDNPQTYIIGEHFYDGSTHLQGDEMDAMMNYQGFLIPLRRWLIGYDLGHENGRPSADPVLLSGEAVLEQWTNFRAAIPWVIAAQQFNQLGSHDTSRILTILREDKALAKLAAVLLMTFLGVPCIYYGDEIGLEGGKDPDNRRTMPWDESAWDNDLHAHYQKLIRLRRAASALCDGGFQSLYGQDGLIAFQRHSSNQRLIVIGYRGPDKLASISVPVWQAGIPDGTTLTDYLSGKTYQVQDGALHLENLDKGAALVLEQAH